MSRLSLAGLLLFGMGTLLNILVVVGLNFNGALLDAGSLAPLFAHKDAAIVDYGDSLLRFLFIMAVIAGLLIGAAILCGIARLVAVHNEKKKSEISSGSSFQ